MATSQAFTDSFSGTTLLIRAGGIGFKQCLGEHRCTAVGPWEDNNVLGQDIQSQASKTVFGGNRWTGWWSCYETRKPGNAALMAPAGLEGVHSLFKGGEVKLETSTV